MAQTTSIHAEASLHRKLVLFAKQLETYLAHFPNAHKYTLTKEIRQAYLDVYNLTTEAQKRYHKKTTLTQLDVRHEQLRMLINLANELGLFDFTRGRKDDERPGDRRHLTLSRLCDELSGFACQTLLNQGHGRTNAAAPKGLGQKLIGDPSLFRPVFAAQRFAVTCEQDRAPLVSELHIPQSPPAVFGAVAQAVVDPLQSVKRAWRPTHVCKKRIKRVGPRFANKNSTRAVIFVVGVFRVPAPLLHAAPPLVKRAFARGRILLSLHPNFRGCLASKAPARTNCPCAQVGRWGDFGLAAVANTQKGSPPGAAGCEFLHKQPPKSEANQVDFLRHFSSI